MERQSLHTVFRDGAMHRTRRLDHSPRRHDFFYYFHFARAGGHLGGLDDRFEGRNSQLLHSLLSLFQPKTS